jgi:hypothetical protein
MAGLNQIAEGWLIYLKSKQKKGISEDIKAMSDERSKICQECPSLVQKEIKIGSREILKYRCSECGCGFPMMTFSKKKKCPLGKW